MRLAPGTKLGPYEILAPLGAGGMGEVYRTRDPRLGREVALKVLPPGCSNDPDRLRRFEQEARVTAALNHPNILAVFDVGRQDDSPYIVSELLEGESLRARLREGPLSVRKAVEYALQILQGLAAAHGRGIFHRDLKPENIFVTRGDHIKILDFGLAKLTLPDPATLAGLSAGPTVDSATGQGVVLGTIGYMSPEQLRGAPSDARSDLFSFGAVLYEMLSGKRPFRGETTADTIGAVLREEPPNLTAAGREVPLILERIVRHCLEKDPGARFQSARDVAFDLEPLSTVSSSAPSPVAMLGKGRRTWLVPALLTLAGVVLVVTSLLIGRWSAPPPTPPEYHQLTFGHGQNLRGARFAPDQRTAIYSAGSARELFSVAPDGLAPISLGLKDADIAAISPAGEMLVIQQKRQLKSNTIVGVLARAPLSGGAPRPILSDVQAADWGLEDKIVVAHFVDGRFRLEYPVGHTLYESGGYVSDVRFSPKGDLVAFADHPVLGDNAGTVAVVDLSGHKRTLSAPQAGIVGLAWAPSGKEVWFSSSDLGGPVVRLNSVDLSGHTRVVAHAPGILAIDDLARNGHVLLRHASWRILAMALGPGQNEERALTVKDWTHVRAISPDGRQALLEEQGTGSRRGYDIFVRSTDGSPPVRVGEGDAYDFSPDMKWVLAGGALSVPRQLYLIPLGPGEQQQITRDSIDHTAAHFLPDGKGIVFTGVEPGHKPRIYTQTIAGSSPRAVSPEGVSGVVPTVDGKFVFGFSDTVALYPLGGVGAPRVALGIHPSEYIASVSPDGRSVLVVSKGQVSLDVFRVDLASGRRNLFKRIVRTDPSETFTFHTGSFTPDGKYYSYSYNRLLAELYTVDGLR